MATQIARIKQALGSAQPGPDMDFENQFAQMAATYVQDRSPRLMPFMIGFQLIDRDADGEKAVGVFGAKAGEQWLYVPVFFLGGRIKGQELLWVAGPDRFVPNKENWVNAMLAHKPFVLGEASDIQNNRASPFHTPNVRRIVRPWEGLTKDAAAVLQRFPTWVHPYLQKYAQARLAEKTASVSTGDLLLDVLRRPGYARYYANTFYKDARIKLAFDHWYGKDTLAGLLARSPERVVPLPVPHAVKEAARRKPKVRVYFADDGLTETPGLGKLTSKQKEQLLRDRRLVVDGRAKGETSTAYDLLTPVKTDNPSVTGVYNLIAADGGVVEATVLCGAGEGTDNCNIVVPHSGEGYALVKPRDLWAVNTREGYGFVPSDSGYEKWFNALPAKASPVVDRCYVAASPTGECTAVFRIDESLEGDRYRASEMSPTRALMYGLDSQARTPLASVLVGGPNAKPAMVGSCLRIPADWRLVDCGRYNYRQHYNQDEAFAPGRPEDLKAMQLKQANLRVYCDGDRTELKVGDRIIPCSKKAAWTGLITRLGFTEDAATDILQTAEKYARQGVTARFLVKYAYSGTTGTLQNNELSLPYFPEPDTYSEEYGPTSAEVNPAMQESVQAETPEYPQPDVFAEPDRQMQSQAAQAAQSGQKELFDVTSLAALLRAPIDENTDNLMGALHELGTRLFQLYARWDEAEKRFGKSQLPEIEDGTRNAFEILGDTIRYYQDKDVRGLPGVLSAAQTSSGPDMETAADA